MKFILFCGLNETEEDQLLPEMRTKICRVDRVADLAHAVGVVALLRYDEIYFGSRCCRNEMMRLSSAIRKAEQLHFHGSTEMYYSSGETLGNLFIFEEEDSMSDLEDTMNKSHFFQNFLGMEDLIPPLIDRFQENHLTLLEHIETAISRQDSRELERAAHTLKGAVSNFRAGPSVAAALLLEVRGKHNDFDGIEKHLEILKFELERLMADLKKVRNEFSNCG